MGQSCSCLEHPPKYQRRQSDDVDTVDMERGEDDDAELELEVLVDRGQETHELLGARARTNSGGRGSQRGTVKRTGSGVAAGLMADADRRDDDEEKESVEQRIRRSLSTGLMGLDADHHPTPSPRPEELSRLLRSYQEVTGVVSELDWGVPVQS
ncbi:unnamed protein product [Phytophthora lilii]|uniref:Unnamed protein product n=1 Tax=Phytophthora lilii TaxID=2077276 RepID=A0A9W6TDH8_9STRA|nr:unnamed protein product [Phytophthora lilii]